MILVGIVISIASCLFISLWPSSSWGNTEENQIYVAYCEQPAWSPDGSKIAFVSAAAYNNIDIWVINVDSTGLKRLTTAPYQREWEPAWSPDGAKIVYERVKDIWVMNADGSNQRKVENPNCILQWYPGTDKLLCLEGKTWLFNPITDEKELLTDYRGRITGKINFSGDKYVFTKGMLKGNYSNIYIENIDGTGKTQLTFGDYIDWNPSWSPDGTHIIFASDRGEQPPNYKIHRLWRINVDGTDLKQITINSYDHPAYSPDGNRIAARGKDSQIWIMNSDGTGEYQLTHLDKIIKPTAPIKFSPDKWNIEWSIDKEKGKGYINCYIGKIEGDPSIGVESYSVDQIEKGLIALTVEVPQAEEYRLSPEGPSQILNHHPGFTGKVLKVKFNKFKAINTLWKNRGKLESGKSYEVLIRGMMQDSQPFSGKTTIQLIGKEK